MKHHAPYGDNLKAKENFEIVSVPSNSRCKFGAGGWCGGGGLWVLHAAKAVFDMPVFTAIQGKEIRLCVQSLFLSFLSASINLKLKTTETNE